MKTIRRCVIAGAMGVVAVGPLAPSAIQAVGAQSTTGDGSGVADDGANAIPVIQDLRSTAQTGRSAVLNWRTLPGVDSYRVYVAGRQAISDDNGWLTVGGLRPGQTYSAQVSAVVGGVEGPLSAPLEFSTTDVTLRDPGLLVDFGVFRLSSSLVPLAWAELDGASIELFRDGVLVDPATLEGFTSRLLDRNVVPGETYVYQARFVSDISGDVGPLGAELVVTVPSNMPTVTATFTDRSVVVLRIDDLGPGLEFEIERDGSSLGIFSQNPFINAQWFVDRSLDPGQTYTYRLRSIGPNGVLGDWTPALTATTDAPLSTTSG